MNSKQSIKLIVPLATISLLFVGCAESSTQERTEATETNEGALSTNQSGFNNGYFYSFWTEGIGSANMNLGPAGNYSTSWRGCRDFIAGKGWATGGRRIVNYSGNFSTDNGFLGLYGWTKDPLVEYFILENYGTYKPTTSYMGSYDSDGGRYDIYRIAQPRGVSIQFGYWQYWSIRQSKRSSGTITTGNHFDAWKSHGMDLGNHSFMILATEGFGNGGNSNITLK